MKHSKIVAAMAFTLLLLFVTGVRAQEKEQDRGMLGLIADIACVGWVNVGLLMKTHYSAMFYIPICYDKVA